MGLVTINMNDKGGGAKKMGWEVVIVQALNWLQAIHKLHVSLIFFSCRMHVWLLFLKKWLASHPVCTEGLKGQQGPLHCNHLKISRSYSLHLAARKTKLPWALHGHDCKTPLPLDFTAGRQLAKSREREAVPKQTGTSACLAEVHQLQGLILEGTSNYKTPAREQCLWQREIHSEFQPNRAVTTLWSAE